MLDYCIVGTVLCCSAHCISGFFLKFQLFTLFEIVFFCQIDTRQTFLKEFKNQSTRIFTCTYVYR